MEQKSYFVTLKEIADKTGKKLMIHYKDLIIYHGLFQVDITYDNLVATGSGPNKKSSREQACSFILKQLKKRKRKEKSHATTTVLVMQEEETIDGQWLCRAQCGGVTNEFKSKDRKKARITACTRTIQEINY